jgi:hypothetical protein
VPAAICTLPESVPKHMLQAAAKRRTQKKLLEIGVPTFQQWLRSKSGATNPTCAPQHGNVAARGGSTMPGHVRSLPKLLCLLCVLSATTTHTLVTAISHAGHGIHYQNARRSVSRVTVSRLIAKDAMVVTLQLHASENRTGTRHSSLLPQRLERLRGTTLAQRRSAWSARTPASGPKHRGAFAPDNEHVRAVRLAYSAHIIQFARRAEAQAACVATQRAG